MPTHPLKTELLIAADFLEQNALMDGAEALRAIASDYVVRVSGKCCFGGCEADATHIACGRMGTNGHPEVAAYCEAHGEIVMDEGFPEYMDECPNCGCGFGVN